MLLRTFHVYRTDDTTAFQHVASYYVETAAAALAQLRADKLWTRRHYWLATTDVLKPAPVSGTLATLLLNDISGSRV